MVTLLRYLPLLKHQDAVRILNSGQTMGDNETGTILHQLVHSLLNLHLRTGVYIGSSFVQNQHG